MKSLILFGLTAAVAASAVAVPAAARSERQCFFAREGIKRWKDVDGGRAVDLRISAGEVWRLTLFGSCAELRSTLTVSLDTRGRASVCEGDRNLSLIVQDASRTSTVRCPVDSVRRLSPEEIAAAR